MGIPAVILLMCLGAIVPFAARSAESPNCRPLATLTSDIPARDLANITRSCVEENDFRTAIQIYLAYSSFILFDQQRVKDKSAQVIVGELNNWIFSGYDVTQIEHLKTWINQLRDPASPYLAETCDAIERIGRPSYRPDYMIERGMQPRKSQNDWIVPDFSARAAWDKALHDLNPCPRP